jgi:hypothetical protein
MHKAWVGAAQTCQLISSCRDRFGDIKKLHRSTGAISVALQLYSFTTVFILTALMEHAVQKVLNYCKHDDFHAMGTPHVASTIFHFMSSMRKFLSTSHNKKKYYMPAV